jgi:hypothetical protein
MYVLMYVLMYVCMYACCMHASMYACVDVWMYVCMYECMYVCMYVCTITNSYCSHYSFNCTIVSCEMVSLDSIGPTEVAEAAAAVLGGYLLAQFAVYWCGHRNVLSLPPHYHLDCIHSISFFRSLSLSSRRMQYVSAGLIAGIPARSKGVK